MTAWDRDCERMAAGIETVARFLIDARDNAAAQGERIRAEQRRHGHAIDTRADAAEGSQAAYSVTCNALAGALQVGSIDVLAGEWQRARGIEPPVLPGELTE